MWNPLTCHVGTPGVSRLHLAHRLYVSLKKIVYLQYEVFIRDGHLLARVEKSLSKDRSHENTPQTNFNFYERRSLEEMRFLVDLHRGHTLRLSISDWLIFKINGRDWLMNLYGICFAWISIR